MNPLRAAVLGFIVLLAIAGTACTTPRAQQVNCSGRLQPINTPASSTLAPPASDTPQGEKDGAG